MVAGESVSIWIDKNGRRHVGIMAAGRRVHRILPQGSTAGDAKQLEAELRAALAVDKAPRIQGDPRLVEIMTLYTAHAEHLRSTRTALPRDAQRLNRTETINRARKRLNHWNGGRDRF